MDIGIIGFGKFGQFLAKLLKDFDVFVTDIRDKKADANKIGVRFVSLREAASKDVVIFCVPVSSLKAALNSSKGFLKEGSVVMDTCSVKYGPSRLMKNILPSYVDIISTHPLFGPSSGKEGVKGFEIVVCPVRASMENLARIKGTLSSLGLKIIAITPEDHDRQIAETQALAHFIGLAFKNLRIKSRIKTPSFNKLMEMKKIVQEDAERLSGDILKYNKYAKPARKKFIKELIEIHREIGKSL